MSEVHDMLTDDEEELGLQFMTISRLNQHSFIKLLTIIYRILINEQKTYKQKMTLYTHNSQTNLFYTL